jgi:hypothetical protein
MQRLQMDRYVRRQFSPPARFACIETSSKSEAVAALASTQASTKNASALKRPDAPSAMDGYQKNHRRMKTYNQLLSHP